MPKDEFDFEDPFELNGMAFLSHEDTTNDMAECFTEEFMRMGYNHKQVLALFRNPQYLGPHMAFEKRGEPFIRDLIADVFARWGRTVVWSSGLSRSGSPEDGTPNNCRGDGEEDELPLQSPDSEPSVEHAETLTDPMGSPIPKLNV